MLQYLVILLDDTSVAYCHADNPLTERNLIPFETLRKAILFGMKENLMIQYVLPDYELPEEYYEVMETIDNVRIMSAACRAIARYGSTRETDVVVFNEVPTADEPPASLANTIVIRLPFKEMMAKKYDIAMLLPKVKRLNLVITDVEQFTDEQIEEYKKALSEWGEVLCNIVKDGNPSLLHQVNILTDRLQLAKMHNCDAGVNNITLAPNGRFYLCPAFYYDEQMGVDNRMNHKTHDCSTAVGDLGNGINIPNPQLLKLDHAPLCRICDAYQCKRCVWLNQKLTWNINTPSHQQCVLAHLERNASRELQQQLAAAGFNAGEEIKEITYLDPFEVREQF